jgi:hypothetical protein
MRSLRVMSILLAIMLGSGACASSEQWARWREHSSHFASSHHLAFSLRNEGQLAAPRVTPEDLTEAQTERWWGDPVVVGPDQLVTR